MGTLGREAGGPATSSETVKRHAMQVQHFMFGSIICTPLRLSLEMRVEVRTEGCEVGLPATNLETLERRVRYVCLG